MACIYDNLDEQPVILMVELEDWEMDELKAACPRQCTMKLVHERLAQFDDAAFMNEVTVFSPFVHSECPAEQLRRMPNLRLIATRSTGYDTIDLDYCGEHGIYVANVPDYGEDTVAEHAFGMLLALTRKIHRCYERTSRGDFSAEGLRGTDLAGKTFGCLGVGGIGARAMRIAGGFGMNRIAFDTRRDALLSGSLGFRYVTFDQLLAESDVLSIHVPLTEKTRHMVDAGAIATMKDGAILVNTARGGVVDSAALVTALREGRLGGACLDVLESEELIGEEAELLSSDYDIDSLRGLVQSHALLKLPNVIITPHNAFNSEEACRRIIHTTLDNIHSFLEGEPTNIVNK